MVASIVLAAAATMAGALGNAKEANDQMSRSTAYLLQIQTRLSDLIMRANDIVDSGSLKLVLWHDDDKNGIQAADNSEYTTIEASGTNLTIYKNNTPTDKETYDNCRLASVTIDGKLVTVGFDLTENGRTQTYAVSAALRGKTN
jgi:hypothetical protein